MNITKQTSYNNTSAYGNRPLQYIVIHYTAGVTSKAGSARNTALYFSNPSVNASADFIVDDTTAVQFNPDIKNHYCWHCGDNKNTASKGGSYYGKCQNYNSIGIEVCSTNSTGRITNANDQYFSFTDAVVDKAVELTKYLMQTYNIPADRVIRHYDVTGKYCPGIKGWNEDSGSVASWNAFKAKLTGSKNATTTTTTTTTSDTLYRVRKSGNDAKTQIGAFKNLQSAKSLADKNKGYSVFDTSGKLLYSPNKSSKKSVAEIAKEVIAGKWGNGSARKTALEKAGYDYNAVQSKVNELLR